MHNSKFNAGNYASTVESIHSVDQCNIIVSFVTIDVSCFINLPKRRTCRFLTAGYVLG